MAVACVEGAQVERENVRAATKCHPHLRIEAMAAAQIGEGKQRYEDPVKDSALWSHLCACRNISPIRNNIGFSFFDWSFMPSSSPSLPRRASADAAVFSAAVAAAAVWDGMR